ncbi:unnamed protein product, partial [Ixodes persulcatus]
MAAVVADALSRTSTAGASQAVPPQAPNPVGIAGAHFTAPFSMDAQPSVTRATTADAWPPLHTAEFQPRPATQHAAAGYTSNFAAQFPPSRSPYDPGSYLPSQPSIAAHTDTGSTHTARQRIFTATDPPSRRDIAEAFLFVQQVARHSQHIGRREVQELQLLELFVDVWDCRCLGLP